MIDSDPYWIEHRDQYLVPGYAEVAKRQKEKHLERISASDEVRDGITVDSDDPDFLRLSALAREAFSCGPFARISLRPDPWKSSTAWRIEADGHEQYIGTDMVRKHLGELIA